MSYRSRLYNHRNPQSPESENKKPFFSGKHESNDHNKKNAFFQAKLSVNAPGDQYEQEADTVANAVVNNKAAKPAIKQKQISSVQRLSTSMEDEKLSTNDQRMERDKEDKVKGVQRMPADAEKEKEKPVQKMGDPKKEEDKMKNVQRMPADAEKEKDKPVQKMNGPKKEEDKMKNVQKMEGPEKEKEKKDVSQPLQKKPVSGASTASPDVSAKIESTSGKGNAMPAKTLHEMNTSFGTDFSDVKIHNDPEATNISCELNAQAFTHGSDIYFNEGKFNPDTNAGKNLLAHELTHVIQQNSSAMQPAIQRRLFVSGANATDPREYVDLVGRAAGLQLQFTFSNPRVNIIGNTVTPVESQSGRNILNQIINNPTQHAEIFVGTHQPGVSIGAFPDAGSTVQDIDIDDIRNLNASLPGQGTSKAFHEMFENFTAHATPGLGPFDPAHAAAVEAESNVAEDEGIAGRRLDQAGIDIDIPDFLARVMGLPTGPNISYQLSRQVFTNYFLDRIEKDTVTPAGTDIEIVRATRTPKTQLFQSTIDGFASGSNAIPPAGAVNLAAALAVLNGTPTSTLLIEGFTDNTGSNAANARQSAGRANVVLAFFTAHGISRDRIAVVGRGNTNFAATNDTPAGRAQNRRVVLTVHN